MKLLFAAAEAAPFAKSGGLGDVMGALPEALARAEKAEVAVILPFYPSIKHNPSVGAEYICHFYMPLAWRSVYVGVFKAVVPVNDIGQNRKHDLVYYFIDNDYYFGREGYGYEDDGERFAFFSKAVLEALPHIGFIPDILHANDWQTGFIPLFFKAFYRHDTRLSSIKTVFTIHNIEYQGKADPSFLPEVLGIDESFRGVVSFDGLVNALKTAIVLCDRLTTVSRTYAFELQYDYFAHGLADIIRENAYKMTGIVNGVDSRMYNPQTDKNLSVPFSAANLIGKGENKRALQKRLGLPISDTVPLVIMVSRLVPHKGLELVEAVLDRLCNMGIQLAVLGTGYAQYEDLFRAAAHRYPETFAACITFDEALSRAFYAGADFLLMPSKSEPCGLSQQIAMRYGTIPIVRETGGLVDTVPPIHAETGEGCGITFKTFNAHDMLYAVERAAALYQNRPLFQRVRAQDMLLCRDWSESAAQYMEIYHSLI